MNTASSGWYIRGSGNNPLGPFEAEQLLESWRARQLDPTTLCWREGMAEWLPLTAVEPLASAIRTERQSAQLRMLRLSVMAVLAVVILVVISGIGYFWWTESATVGQARQLIAAQHFEEASTLLEQLAKKGYFFCRRADYMLALALVREFASASRAKDAGDDLLDDAKKQLEKVFAASSTWRGQAESDLAGVIVAVPNRLTNALERSVRLADFLSAMRIVDRKRLAAELLSKAKSLWSEQQRGTEESDGEAVAWIVKSDTALAEDVLAAIVPDTPGMETNIEQRMACIQSWGRAWPALAAPLETGLVTRASKLATAGVLEKPHLLVATTKRIDSQFDVWAFWESHFQKANGNNSRDAIAILKFMVEDEQNAERLKKAKESYGDLQKRHPDAEMTPPDSIRDLVNGDRLHELILEAEQSAKNSQYQDARTKLENARRQFSALWSRDADADRVDKEVRFHLGCEEARKSFEKGDFTAALASVTDAIQIRPEDKEAEGLRGKIQAAIDKSEIEQHRQRAEDAVVSGDLRNAVNEITMARDLLERPTIAAWGAPHRAILDKLAKTVVGRLHDKAKTLSERRQYEDAQEEVKLGLQLTPGEERMTELRRVIKGLEDDPKTTNVSGMWSSIDGFPCRLTDDGGDAIGYEALKLPSNVVSCAGSFRREGDSLKGRFQVVLKNSPRAAVRIMNGTLRDAHTFVFSFVDRLPNPKKAGEGDLIGKGEGSWTQEQAGAERPSNADTHVVSPPRDNSPESSQSQRTTGPTKGTSAAAPRAPTAPQKPLRSARAGSR